MSIRWIRSVLVDGKQTTLEVMLGSNKISDKCYIRVNQEEEHWFHPADEGRETILRQGLGILKNRFEGRRITVGNGSAFSWL